jgi:alpha-tubulin suppressor-like RCC1 family protein
MFFNMIKATYFFAIVSTFLGILPIQSANAQPAINSWKGFGPVIASKKQHTCAVSESLARVYCWGDQYANTHNLGQDSDPDVLTAFTPKLLNMGAVAPDAKIRQIVPDTRVICVLVESGDAYCWNNVKPAASDAPLLGSKDIIASPVPVKVSQGERPDGIGFSKLSISGQKICGLGNDAKLYCWGANTRQLPLTNKATPSAAKFTVPVQMATNNMGSDEGIIDLGVSTNYICVLTTTAKLYCNQQGVLKAIDTSAVLPGASLKKLTAHATTSDLFGLLADDGSAYVLGVGEALSFGSENAANATTLTLRKVAQGDMPPNSKVIAISRGDNGGLGCVLLQAGTVHCWGNRYIESPGNGKINFFVEYVPKKISQGEIPPTTKILDVQCGASHCVAYGTDRLIYSWGRGEGDVLGREGLAGSGAAAPVMVAAPAGIGR